MRIEIFCLDQEIDCSALVEGPCDGAEEFLLLESQRDHHHDHTCMRSRSLNFWRRSVIISGG